MIEKKRISKGTISLLYFLIFALLFPFFVSADGMAVKPSPDGDWTWVGEDSQEAFINYEDGIEKLIIKVELREQDSDIVWITPIPGSPKDLNIDITSDLPVFFGDEVLSKAKIAITEGIKSLSSIGLLSQIWTVPFSIFFVSFAGSSGEAGPADLVSVRQHVEKEGMTAEVISAKSVRAIYEYLSGKGLQISPGSINVLDEYVEKDCVFVVAWISPGFANGDSVEKRGIFITFPTPEIYYPLFPTSVYGDQKIPITIRVLGHVQPKVYSEIKPYIETQYFTSRTRSGHSAARDSRCISAVSQLNSLVNSYFRMNGVYPVSLDGLKEAEILGLLFQEMKDNCWGPISYHSNGKTSKLTLILGPEEAYVWDSSEPEGVSGNLVQGVDIKDFIFSPALRNFYGQQEPWRGKADYTKISINAPPKTLKQDLWMKEGGPFVISFVSTISKNAEALKYVIYFFVVALFSFIAGGIVGLSCLGKFKKYALLGLANIFTLVGFVLALHFIKEEKESRCSKSRFVFLFSIIFVLLISIFWFLSKFLLGA